VVVRFLLIENAKYLHFDLLVVMVPLFLLVILLILPRGTVRDEGTFFIMLTILIALIGVAIVLRRKRLENR
jgi:TRAP-type uncharacterized transport system fused permease subunit